jgi:preprotein translocase subunit SecD
VSTAPIARMAARRTTVSIALVGPLLAGCGASGGSGRSVTSAHVAGGVRIAEEAGPRGERAAGVRLVYRAQPTAAGKLDGASLKRTVEIMRERADQLGISGAEVGRFGAREIAVLLPAGRDTRLVQAELGATARLYFYDWEPNVIGPQGRPAVTSPTVTGGPEAAAVRYGLDEYQAIVRAAKRPAIVRANDTTLQPGCTAAQIGGCVYGSWYLLDTRHERVLCAGAGPICAPQSTERGLYADGYRPPAGAAAKAVRIDPGTVLVQASPYGTAGKDLEASPNSFYVLNDDPALGGEDIRDPAQSFQEGEPGTPVVTFGFTARGGAAFEGLTRRVARRGLQAQLPGVTKADSEQHFAVVFDGQVIAAPSVDYTQYPEGVDAANGSEIAGDFTVASARSLAQELRFGALPIELELVSRSRVPLPASGRAS